MKKSFYLNSEIVIIGLGYVGLPLAVKLSESFKVIGYDKSIKRIKGLKKGFDFTKEISSRKLNNNKNLIFTSNPIDIYKKNTYIVTVPTPVKKNNKPGGCRSFKVDSERINDLWKILTFYLIGENICNKT